MSEDFALFIGCVVVPCIIVLGPKMLIRWGENVSDHHRFRKLVDREQIEELNKREKL